jgi:hypothetical protein
MNMRTTAPLRAEKSFPVHKRIRLETYLLFNQTLILSGQRFPLAQFLQNS